MNSDKSKKEIDAMNGPPVRKAAIVLGLFETPDALLAAISVVKAKAIGRLEAYTPYPVHGLDEALELRRSPLGGMVMVMGGLGAATALLFQWWMSAVDYPVLTGGKATFSWQAFVPILFELMVLFATFTAGLGMLLLLNRLPFFGHPVLQSRAIKSVTRDRFALALEAEGGDFDADAARAALASAGALEIEVLLEAEAFKPFEAHLLLRTLTGIAAACAVSGVITFGAVKLFPILPPMSHMHDQPRLDPQRASAFFRDGHGMQLPVAGTVARGHMPLGVATQEEAALLVNPVPRTALTLEQGRRAFNIRCSLCHGATGNGVSTLTAAYGAKPANLLSAQFREYPDGKLYWAIVKGKNAMPSYAADMSEEERWAAIHYVRALQRAQHAKDEDMK